ncbi:hypothetical protein [Streptomyces sp. NTH33]|uniref:hypothetical protein n=1 Tax=Streptomyces sp. NTH33 TaxID=1735453 RepID=UPI0015E8A6EB|nr:hypothetical protein [Streptomyces sp. NTH33]
MAGLPGGVGRGSAALGNVHEVLNATSLGHPDKGAIYRPAGTPADADTNRQFREEQRAASAVTLGPSVHR